jgi:hypothetical protein
LPDSYSDEDIDEQVWEYKIDDMTEMHLDYMIYQMQKNGFGTKDFIERNYGLVDYFKQLFYAKYDDYCEKVYLDRLRAKNK